MPTSQQPVPSSHMKEPAGQVDVCRTSRPRASMPPKTFLPEVSSAAAKPVCRTSNAEIKIFDSILKKIMEAGLVTSGIILRSCRW